MRLHSTSSRSFDAMRESAQDTTTRSHGRRAQADEFGRVRRWLKLSCQVLLSTSFVELFTLGVGTSRDLDRGSDVAVFEVALLIDDRSCGKNAVLELGTAKSMER